MRLRQPGWKFGIATLAVLVVGGCMWRRSPPPPKRQAVFIPSIKRLRFFNDTSRDTEPVDPEASHIAVWHHTDVSEPPEQPENQVMAHEQMVASGASVALRLRQIMDVSTLAVKCRFRIEGHPTTTVWAPLPASLPGSYIRALRVRVTDDRDLAPKGLAVTTQVVYMSPRPDGTWGPEEGVAVTTHHP